MAKVRNVSPEALIVPELRGRVVAPDEVVDVPDDRVDAYTYQDRTWALVEAAPKKKGD
jgi:hypothetical protein